jgi:DnaJ-class molecular chaperone
MCVTENESKAGASVSRPEGVVVSPSGRVVCPECSGWGEWIEKQKGYHRMVPCYRCISEGRQLLRNNPETICKLLRAIAKASDAQLSMHDVILNAAADMIETLGEAVNDLTVAVADLQNLLDKKL